MVSSMKGNFNQISPTNEDREKDPLGELKNPLPSDDERKTDLVHKLNASWPPSIQRRERSMSDEVEEDSCEFPSISNDESQHSIHEHLSPTNEGCEKDPLEGKLKSHLPSDDECKKDLVHKFHNSCPPSILRRGASMSDDVYLTQTRPGIDTTTSKVSFQSVQIREYKIALVENPGCTRGPPIGLGESYTVKDDIDLLTYETERGPRRNRSKLQMNKWKRKNILKFTTDHTDDEIKQVTKDVQRTRSGRSFSSALWPFLDAKEALGDAGKKVIRKMKRNKDMDPALTQSAHF